MKHSKDLIFGDIVNISIIYHIPDSCLYSLNAYDFSFDHVTGENRELNLRWLPRVFTNTLAIEHELKKET